MHPHKNRAALEKAGHAGACFAQQLRRCVAAEGAAALRCSTSPQQQGQRVFDDIGMLLLDAHHKPSKGAHQLVAQRGQRAHAAAQHRLGGLQARRAAGMFPESWMRSMGTNPGCSKGLCSIWASQRATQLADRGEH